MSNPSPTPRSIKESTPPSSNIVTRNGARKAKIQTRAMSAGSKPSNVHQIVKRKGPHKKRAVTYGLVKDHLQIAMDSKPLTKLPTGFVTDPIMLEHSCLFDDNYPECPERLIAVIKRCHELKLIEQCKEFVPRSATKEELLMLHSPFVYEMMETTHRNHDLKYLEELSTKYDAVYFHPSTQQAALSAAGCTIDMVDRILSGEVQNGAVFVRPPGHHAMRAEPCGYCFYNNVALAAKHAISVRGLTRVLIVDWDVHHGQGTQQMFYDDPRVVYFSIHRYEHGSFWPNLRQSDFDYVGCGRGKGYNFNVPLNATGMKDADYLAIWHQLLLPMAIEYQPELIIISAGYDAAIGCPEGEMELTSSCFASLTHQLCAVTTRVCVVLEGGYCCPSLADGAAHTLRALLGHAPPALPMYTEPTDMVRDTILNCIYAHKAYWRCFNFQDTYSANDLDLYKEALHTVTVKWLGDETRPDRFPLVGAYPLQDDLTRNKLLDRIMNLRIVTDLSTPQYQVCYVYDPAMLKHKNICEPGHLECPERILNIHMRHKEFGLLERVHQLEPRVATDEEILCVHTQKHLDRLKELSSTKLRNLNVQKKEFDSVYFHPASLESARVATGCVLQAVDTVLSNVAGSGVCVIRPPGHHADDEVPSGFCLLNNVATAAKYAVDSHGLKRVLIVDWDVHHGNGTQRITYSDNKILYMSLHRYDNGSFFPYSADANYTSVGEGRGEGYNVNVAWNKGGMGDTEYCAAFTNVLLPIAYEYDPELVLVSAGFDACVEDPLGGCKVTPECYGRLTLFLKALARGRVILCLEGGYNVTSISYAMVMCTKALLGDPIQHHYNPKSMCHKTAVESIRNTIRVHKKYWKSLKFQISIPEENVLPEPPPSRGLTITDDQNDTFGHEKSLEISLSSTLDSNCKSPDKEDLNVSSEVSLESSFANLSIEKQKCSDGVHCGTDDEDDKDVQAPSSSKEKKVTKILSANDSKGHEYSNGQSSSSKGKEIHEFNVEINEACLNKDVEGKMTLVDYLADNMQAIVQGDMFAVIPLPWCPHLETLYAIPPSVKFEQGVKCMDCDETVENWVCLHCYITACGRCVNGHMKAHHEVSGHAVVLSLLDLSVWCNVCDSYVDNHLLYDAKNNAHRCKFNEDMPWSYPDTH